MTRDEAAAPVLVESRWRTIDELRAVCICTFVVAILLFWVVHRALIDDAYITLSYAKNLAFHGDWGLIPQEPANTASSPLFVILLAGATLVLRDPIWAAGATFVGANVMLAWWATKTAQTLGLAVSSAALAVALVLLNPVILSATGMETTLAVTLIVGLLCYAVQGRPVAFGVVTGLAILTRPDLVIFVGLLGLSTAAIRRRLVKVGCAAAVVGGPWMVWSWLHFGSAIPDTYVLKTLQHSFDGNWAFKNGPFFMLDRNAAAAVLSFAPALVGSVVLLAGAVMRLRAGDTVDRRFDPLLAFGAGGIGYYIAYSVLGVPAYQWYYGPVIAALSAFAGLLLPHLLANAAGTASVRARLVVAGQALLAIIVLGEAVVVIGHDLPWRESVIQNNFATPAEYARIGTPLRARIGDQTVMNLGEIGTLAFFCQCAIVDHFSDRGWIIPQVETRIAHAGPVARFLLRLNYRYLDRDLLPRPPEYTLVWEPPGSTDDPNSWEAGRGRVRLLDQFSRRRVSLTETMYADLLGHLDLRAIDSMTRDVIASLPPGRGPVLLRVSSAFDRYYQFRLARELKRRHVLVRLDPETAGTPGALETKPALAAASARQRTYDGRPVRVLLTVSSGYDINRLASRPEELVAYVGTVSREQRVEIAKRARELDALHSSGQLSDHDYVNSLLSAQGKLGTDLAVISSSQ